MTVDVNQGVLLLSAIIHVVTLCFATACALGDLQLEMNGVDLFRGKGAHVCFVLALLSAAAVVALVQGASSAG